MSKDKRWKPVRRGEIYCSPGCGYGCTYEDFQWATNRAQWLANRLGEGWVPEVWEDGRWFYKAKSPNGLIEVYGKATSKTYWATTTCGQFHCAGATPQKALNGVLAQIRLRLAKFAEILEHVR